MSALAAPALRARGLRVRLGDTEVLHDMDVDIASASWTSVVGPNGAGKSTLLKALAGLLPAMGEVWMMGEPLLAMSAKRRAQQLSWLGQSEPGADDLNAWDVVMLGRLPHQRWMAAPSTADEAACERALKATQAWHWRERPLGALSGGERQRVLLARALAVEAQVYLMDEPLANLDPPHQADWLGIVRALVHEGKTVVSVLHEAGMALQADQLLILDAGRVAHMGCCQAPQTHRALEAVFDGRLSVQQLGDQFVALPVAVRAA